MPRGVAQSGSAPGWGPGGRRFKSCLPDEKSQDQNLPEIHEHEPKSAKRRGFVVGCSRLFPAVPGTRDRKRTAATGEGDRKGWQPCTGVSGDGPAIGNDSARNR
jgi:hypothetical protein